MAALAKPDPAKLQEHSFQNAAGEHPCMQPAACSKVTQAPLTGMRCPGETLYGTLLDAGSQVRLFIMHLLQTQVASMHVMQAHTTLLHLAVQCVVT